MRYSREHETQIKSHISGRTFSENKNHAITAFDAANYADLQKIGIHILPGKIAEMQNAMAKYVHSFGMDAIQPTITTGSIPDPVQFLQTWLPGLVAVVTAKRAIDEFVGITAAGSWANEQVIQGMYERTGTAAIYGDYTNVPLSSWNVNYESRTVMRFEEGMQVGVLEQMRAAAVPNLNPDAFKRDAAALSLEIIRNYTGFYGFASGVGRTYGFLNDPGLPAYVNVPTGVSGLPWSGKTFLEICRDIITAAVALQTQSQGLIDPFNTPLTLAVATNSVGFLAKISDFGISVIDFINKTYNIRVVNAPQLNNANSNANVFYLYADRVVDDGSSDGGRTFDQLVTTKFMTVGVQQLTKSYIEDFANGTAGILLKRPYAVVRYSGI